MAKNCLKSTKDIKLQIQEVLAHSKDQLNTEAHELNTHTHTHTHAHKVTSQKICWKPGRKKNTILKAT